MTFEEARVDIKRLLPDGCYLNMSETEYSGDHLEGVVTCEVMTMFRRSSGGEITLTARSDHGWTGTIQILKQKIWNAAEEKVLTLYDDALYG